MPRLTLQHYDIPNYAQMIPNKPRSERPIQKIADLLYVLHGIPWFKKKMEGSDGLATADGNQGYDQTELQNDVSQGIVNDDLKQRATERARSADFGLDQSMPIELQLMGVRKPLGADDSAYEKGGGEGESKGDEKDDFEKALDDAERKRKNTLEQDPFEMSANKDKEGVKDMQRAAGLEGKEVDAIWGPRSERARQRALHPEDSDTEDELWADAEMERYIDNAINRELWGE